MRRKIIALLSVAVLALVAATAAFADGPSFMPAIYADGKVFSTKGLNELPAPNGRNDQSFDPLLKFTNGVEGQLAVAEAAPGNPDFNGGRWAAKTAEWTASATPTLITSYAQALDEVAAGHLVITDGDPDGGPDYFECPLVPGSGLPQ